MGAMYDPASGAYMGEVPDGPPADQEQVDRLRRDWTTSPQRAVRTFAAGVAQAPSMAASVFDAAGIVQRAPRHFFNRIVQQLGEGVDDIPNSTVGDRLNRVWANSHNVDLIDTGKKALADTQYDQPTDIIMRDRSDEVSNRVGKEIEEFVKTHPDATNRMIADFQREATDKGKYPLTRLIDHYNRTTEDLIGAPHAEDRNVLENVILNAAPAALPSKATGALSLIDPRTTHFTPGGVATNAAIGGALGGALAEAPIEHPEDIALKHAAQPIGDGTLAALPNTSDANGNPIVTYDLSAKTPDEEIPNKEKADSVAGMLSPALAVSIFGLAFGRSRGPMISPVIKEMAEKATATTMKAGAPNPSGKIDPTVAAKTAFNLDEQTAVTRAMKQAGLPSDEAITHTQEGTEHVRHNVGMKVDNWIKSGVLPDGQNTTSWVQMDNLRNQIRAKDPNLDSALNTYLAAVQRDSDTTRNVTQMTNQISDLNGHNAYLANELTRPGLPIKKQTELKKLIADNNDKIAELNGNLGKIYADVPEARTSMRDFSFQDVQRFIREGNNVPEFVQMRSMIAELAKADREFQVNNGTLTREMADYLAQHEYALPLYNDPYIGKNGTPATGFERAWLVTKDRMLRSREDKFGDPGEAAVARAFGPIHKKDLDVDKLNAVNMPINYMDAWRMHMERMIRYNERVTYQRNTVDNIMSGPNWQDVLKLHTANGNPLFSREQLKFHINDAKGMFRHKLDDIVIIPRGDAYQVVEPMDKMLYHTLQQAPLARTPIVAPMTNAFKMMTTGVLRPAFALTSAHYDLATIQALRPMDSVYGSGAIAHQLGSVTRIPGLDKLGQAISAVKFGYDHGLTWMAFQHAFTSYLQQNKLRIGRSFMNNLTGTSDFFNAVAKIPGAQPYLQRLGKVMVDSYADSLWHTLSTTGVMNNYELTHLINSRLEFEKAINIRVPNYLKYAGSPLTEVYHQYRMMMASVESASRVAYAMRNIQMVAERRYGGDWTRMPEKEIKKWITAARTMGGDFARKPGSEVMQHIESSTPYLNIMAQTTAAITRAFVKNPTAASIGIMGAVVPVLVGEWLMTNWDDEARKWRYDNTPEFKRTSTFVMPNAETLYEFATTGKMPAFSPDKVTMETIVPEFRPIAASMAEFFRAMGAYGPNGNHAAKEPGAETVMSLMAEGLKQSYGIQLPPVLQGMMVGGGVKMDLGNMFNVLPRLAGADPNNSKNMINPVAPSIGAARAGAGEPMNLSSGVSSWYSDVLGTVFGAMATTAIQGFDTTKQVYERNGHNLAEAVIAGMQEVGQRERQYVQKDTTPPLWNAQQKIYRSNPVNDELTEVRRALGVVSGKNAKVTGNTGEMLLDQIANQLRYVLRNDPQIAGIGKQYKAINEKLGSIEANRMLTFDQREEMKKPLLLQMQAMNYQQLNHIREMEKKYATRFGDQWKQTYGVPFSYQDFSARIQEAARKKKAASAFQ